ncbi:hypothetical protein HK107_03900 [Parvularcula sp. ZS-1/3]|uniref:SPOR domain-containing protein n=1 Tax=Parvularcula mediterranea TaxID=2732508 RepID=A0A7Y3RJZ2_9PROT|nr:hypothetical protein [Parvularcula mediterranea]NNU15463.1 hypothetical protein [Parvularcula mediterranea]
MSKPASKFKLLLLSVLLAPGMAAAQSLDSVRDPLRLEPKAPAPAPEPAEELEAAVEDEEFEEEAALDEEGEGAMVHLASYYSESAALRGWEILASRHPEELDPRTPLLREVDLGERGIFIRLYAGPLPGESEAFDLCSALRGAGAYCVPASAAGDFLTSDFGTRG